MHVAQRLEVRADRVGRKGPFGVDLLVAFGDQQVPVGGDIPQGFHAATDIIDRVVVVLGQRVVVVLAAVRLVGAGRREAISDAARVCCAAGKGAGDIVDIAAVVVVIDRGADGQLV